MTTKTAQKTPPNQGPQGRLWRTEHIVEAEAVSEESNGWAISYSDLLMVLMSFFIIFFSYQEEKPQDLLSDLAISFNGKQGFKQEKSQDSDKRAGAGEGAGTGMGAGAGTGAGAGSGAGAGAGAVAGAGTGTGTGTGTGPGAMPLPEPKKSKTTVEDLGEHLNKLLSQTDIVLKIERIPKGLNIVFKNDLFAKRRYKITPDIAVQLDRVLEPLKEKKDTIELYFIGHTDSQKVSQRKDLINDNFMLSSLRATSALEYALSKGFDPESVYTQGAADNIENLRTITVRVQLKKTDAAKK